MALRRSQPGSPPEGGATAGAERMTTAGGGAPVASTQEVLRRLELNVNRRLDGILHGEYRGLVPGHGSEPGETRIYAPGDDTRRIVSKLEVEPAAVMELNAVFRARGYRKDMGVKGAVAVLFNRRFIKSKKAATSNWALPRLSEAQLIYAANDAWAAARVYHALGLD